MTATVCTPRLAAFLRRISSFAALFVIAAPGAHANPQDGVVSAGQAAIYSQGDTLTVQQHSNRAVIDWRSFDIDAGETTRFEQPGSSSVILNRVNANDPSRIFGTLTANGNVVIVNPNGVVFGKGSRVDVNGLIATTADIDNAQFMQGGMSFNRPGNPDASIVNEGAITAKDAGLVGLVAPNVENRGVITARMGRVQLSSGDTATVDLYGDRLMEVAVSDNVKKQLVRNTGTINASGGAIAMTAAAGRNVVDSLIDVRGELKAPTVSQKNGAIYIADDDGVANTGDNAAHRVVVQASIDASGRGAHETGGTVGIFGNHVAVKSGSVIDASGTNGGGAVRVGGGRKGGEGFTGSNRTTVEKGAAVKADAVDKGDGGTVTVWSDGETAFDGSIEARGGAHGGAGGSAETSGEQVLKVTGTVDLSSTDDKAYGTWLLDPSSITIYNRSGSGDQGSTFTAAQLETMSSSADIVLSATGAITFDMTGDTVNLANNRSITLTAGTDITSASNGTVNVSGSGGVLLTATNDINIANNLDFAAAGTGAATLQAGNSIILSGGTDITTHGGNIVLNSDHITDAKGAIYVTNSIFTTNGGSFIAGGGSGVLGGTDGILGNGDGTGADDTPAYGTTANIMGIRFNNADISTGAGSIFLQGYGITTANASSAAYGVQVYNGSYLKSTTGAINIKAVGGKANTNGSSGLYLANSGTILETAGKITLDGTGGYNGSSNHGIVLSNSALIDGKGSALISMRGIGKGGGAIGLDVIGTTNTIRNATGNITLDFDNITMDNSISLSTPGTLTIEQYSVAAKTVGLGAGAGTLNLNDTELGGLSAGSYIFGSANSSVVTVNTAHDFGNGNVSILSGSDIDLTGSLTKGSGSGTASYVLQAAGTIHNDSGSARTINIGGGTGSLDITLAANTLDMTNLTAQTTGTVTLKPYTASNSIGISGGSGALNISDATLANIAAGKLVIGDSANGTGDIDEDGWDLSGKAYAVELYGNDIDLGGLTLGSGDFKAYAKNNGGDLGDLTVSAAVTKGVTGASALKLWADNDIVDGGFNIDAGSGILNATLTADKDNDSAGAVRIGGATVASNNGDIALAGTVLTGDTVFNAGTGTLAFGGAVNGAYNLTGSGATISLAADLGGDTALHAVSLTAANALALPSITAQSITARTTGAAADVTVASGKTLTASGTGTAITLAAGRNFINSSGAGALSAPNGRWLVYSAQPSANTLGGLSGDFNRYSCTYGGTCPSFPATGNGLLYSYTPLLTVTPSAATATYGSAANLNGYAYSLSGYLAGEGTDTVTGTLNGTTAYALNDTIGTYNVDYGTGSLTSALGYGFTYANNATALAVGKLALTVSTASQSKVQGDADPVFTGSANLTAYDAGLVSFLYAPQAYSGATGTYTIGATATDPSGRLANYTRANAYGTLTVTPPPAPARPATVVIPNTVLQVSQSGASTGNPFTPAPTGEPAAGLFSAAPAWALHNAASASPAGKSAVLMHGMLEIDPVLMKDIDLGSLSNL